MTTSDHLPRPNWLDAMGKIGGTEDDLTKAWPARGYPRSEVSSVGSFFM
jgi:hypothetical protein